MKTTARRKKQQATGEDLWSWAERREPPALIREDPPAQPGWYRGLIKKISGVKEGA
ncbi:MAG: hypothetical protein NTV93_04105 [Verrucomicrobia bacterium]|nr:hypothetical protein [Verrucomicrobiota bacterium]